MIVELKANGEFFEVHYSLFTQEGCCAIGVITNLDVHSHSNLGDFYDHEMNYYSREEPSFDEVSNETASAFFERMEKEFIKGAKEEGYSCLTISDVVPGLIEDEGLVRGAHGIHPQLNLYNLAVARGWERGIAFKNKRSGNTIQLFTKRLDLDAKSVPNAA